MAEKNNKTAIFLSESLKGLKPLFPEKAYNIFIADKFDISMENIIFILDEKRYNSIKGKLARKSRYNFIIVISDEKVEKSAMEDVKIFPAKFSNGEFFVLYVDQISKKLRLLKDHDDMEAILSAYESVTELSRKELLNAYQTLKAHEIVGEMSRQELINAYRILKAQESTGELARKELIDSKETSKAWERVSELSSNELKDAKAGIVAQESASEFSRSERIEQDKSLKAWDNVAELSRQELIASYTQLRKILQEKEIYLKSLEEKNKKLSKEKKRHGGRKKTNKRKK